MTRHHQNTAGKRPGINPGSADRGACLPAAGPREDLPAELGRAVIPAARPFFGV